MSKKTLFLAVWGIILLSGFAFAYGQEIRQEKTARQIRGTVLAFNPTQLKVRTQISGSSRFVRNFNLTEKTKFIGTLGLGKAVRVIYLRKKLNKRIFGRIALSVEVLLE